MATVEKVLVVGGGIGGLVLASTLRDLGVEVDLVEVKEQWTVYGVGIIQQSNVMQAMERAGLLDGYLGAGFPFDNVGIYGVDGRRLALIPGHRLAGPQYPANLGVSRRALHDFLVGTVLGKGARVRLGVTVEGLDDRGDRVRAAFTDGTQGNYDLVVGADGVSSRVRELVFGDKYKPRFTGQGGWRHNFERRPEVDHLGAYVGARNNAAGVVPLSQDLMYMYLTTSEPGNPRFKQEELVPAMRSRMDGFGGLIAELREQITDPDQVVYRPFEEVWVDEDWFRGRTLIIGDAAHATTPHFGQGAGMAIEDAVVLAELLAQGKPVPDTLRRFMDRRLERCRHVHHESVRVGDLELRGTQHDRAALTAAMTQFTAQPF